MRPSRTESRIARGAALAGVLALLATSPPDGWRVDAAIAGPTTAPPTGALRVEIASSQPPGIDAVYAPASASAGLPCATTWVAGQPLVCLLPPGATLRGVSIGGSCAGCKGACPPPSGAFVTASTAVVSTWTDTVTTRATATLPAHGPEWIATRVAARVDGGPFVRATLTITLAGATLWSESAVCGAEPDGAKSCEFLVFDDVFAAGPAAVDLTLTATALGACEAPACDPPGGLVTSAPAVIR